MGRSAKTANATLALIVLSTCISVTAGYAQNDCKPIGPIQCNLESQAPTRHGELRASQDCYRLCKGGGVVFVATPNKKGDSFHASWSGVQESTYEITLACSAVPAWVQARYADCEQQTRFDKAGTIAAKISQLLKILYRGSTIRAKYRSTATPGVELVPSTTCTARSGTLSGFALKENQEIELEPTICAPTEEQCHAWVNCEVWAEVTID